jgi:branched-chain amino acid transport system permease protein
MRDISTDRLIRIAIAIGAVVLIALYPLYQQDLVNAIGDRSTVSQFVPTLFNMVVICVYVTMAIGLNMVVGYAGLLDLGYVAFYAVGAYVAGWFATQQFSQKTIHFGDVGSISTVPGIHISIWVLMIAAGLLAALFGIIIGLPTLRLRGDYLAIVTLGFGEIIPQFVRNADSIHGFNLTNGSFGLSPIDPLGFGNTIHGWLPFLPANFLTESDADRWYYWVGITMVAFTIFCSIRIRDSRLGRAWVAIREDEIAAGSMGVPLMRTKTAAYALGALFGGAAGCFFAAYKGATFPGDFYLNISIIILCMVVLGGMGNVWGVTLGAVVITYLNFQGLGAIGNNANSAFGTHWDVPSFQGILFGGILVIMMLFRPEGLIPSRRRRIEFEFAAEESAEGLKTETL